MNHSCFTKSSCYARLLYCKNKTIIYSAHMLFFSILKTLIACCIYNLELINNIVDSYLLFFVYIRSLHYYRMDLLSRAVTAFSPGYRAGTTIPRLKVPPLVPGHRAGTKEEPLVPVGVTNQD